MELERRRRPRERRPVERGRGRRRRARWADDPGPPDAPQRAAERIERRLRLRVTADDVDTTAQHLWSRSLEDERERRVADRHTVTGGSAPHHPGHVSRDLDRELAHEMEKRAEPPAAPDDRTGALTPDEAAWEATRLNIILANKGYSDSDVTRWWNFTRHRELGDQTIAEAWRDGRYSAVEPADPGPARQAAARGRLSRTLRHRRPTGGRRTGQNGGRGATPPHHRPGGNPWTGTD